MWEGGRGVYRREVRCDVYMGMDFGVVTWFCCECLRCDCLLFVCAHVSAGCESLCVEGRLSQICCVRLSFSERNTNPGSCGIHSVKVAWLKYCDARKRQSAS